MDSQEIRVKRWHLNARNDLDVEVGVVRDS